MNASRLGRDSPESRAIEAGEIDAVIDHARGKVVLLSAARRALRKAARNVSAASQQTPGDGLIANRLLSALPPAEYQRLLPGFQPLTLKLGQVLHETGQSIDYVYFPVDCVVCLLATAQHPRALGINLVGSEGMVGVSLVLGAKHSSVRAMVQSTGTAMRMKAERFQEALRECPTLRRQLYEYAHAKLILARQTVACNAFHSVDARAARWLLWTCARGGSSEFLLTQASLAMLLGVRRATANEAAGRLRERKLISYSRGRIGVLDPKRLAAAACECYDPPSGGVG